VGEQPGCRKAKKEGSVKEPGGELLDELENTWGPLKDEQTNYGGGKINGILWASSHLLREKYPVKRVKKSQKKKKKGGEERERKVKKRNTILIGPRKTRLETVQSHISSTLGKIGQGKNRDAGRTQCLENGGGQGKGAG